MSNFVEHTSANSRGVRSQNIFLGLVKRPVVFVPMSHGTHELYVIAIKASLVIF
jgi:hypothetical protein